MKKKNIEAVGDSAHDLAQDLKTDLINLGVDVARLASDYVGPRARVVADYLGPKIKEFGDRGAQFAEDTRDTLQPKVAQFASTTRETLQPYVDDAKDRLQPHLDDAKDRIAPLVDTGRDKLNRDVMPLFSDAFDQMTAAPQTVEAKKRLAAAKAALAGDLALPEPVEKRSFGKTLLQVVLASGLLAGVTFAIKRFLAPEESGWQAHEPSQPYRARDEYLAQTAHDVAEAAAQDLRSEPLLTTPVVDDALVADTADTDLSQVGADLPPGADPFQVMPHGEGSFKGAEPPADYDIKGNERSMKYHVQGSAGYDRTIADVWFNSTEAAEAAGFTRAQR